MVSHDEWPALPYEEWAPTKDTLQMCTQMLGKARLALAPPLPEWLHSCLYLDSRGFATGPMPYGPLIVAMGIDIFESILWISLSDGREATISLGRGRCVAEIWADFQATLTGLGFSLDLWDKPQETIDSTPFSENTHHCTLDPQHARRFFSVLAACNGVFERFRSPFFGRTGVQFWWGSFDFTVLLFTGRHEPATDERGYIMRHDLDAQHMHAGFLPGNASSPSATFYAYLVPQPANCVSARIDPPQCLWVESLGEWVLAYDAVRALADPGKAVLDFFNSVYQFALSDAGWDAGAHSYEPPGPAPGRAGKGA
jgi:hypothetical protein